MMIPLSSSDTRVLILSKDPTLLHEDASFGDSLQRHLDYAHALNTKAPGSELRIITYSPKSNGNHVLNPARNLKIYGTASTRRFLFLLDALVLIQRLEAEGWIPDIITSQSPYEDGQLACWLAKRYEARLIPQLHFDLFSKSWEKESFLNPLRKVLSMLSLDQAHAIRVVSSAQTEALVKNLGISPSLIHRIPVRVDFQPSQKSPEECKASLHPRLVGKKVVLFAGKLYPPKNLPFWMRVAQKIKEIHPQTEFILAGDGVLERELKDLGYQLGLEDSILFLGKVPHHQLRDIYGSADVFLLTSRHEGFARVLVESSLCAVPSVVSDCAGPRDIIKHEETGFLCPPDDLSSFVHNILILLNDENKRVQMGYAARNHVQSLFNQKELTRRLVELWLKE